MASTSGPDGLTNRRHRDGALLLRRANCPGRPRTRIVEKTFAPVPCEYPAEEPEEHLEESLMSAAVVDDVKPSDSPRSLGGLTEQQLLAMPERDYISGAQL